MKLALIVSALALLMSQPQSAAIQGVLMDASGAFVTLPEQFLFDACGLP